MANREKAEARVARCTIVTRRQQEMAMHAKDQYLTPIEAADPALLAEAIAAAGVGASAWRSDAGEIWLSCMTEPDLADYRPVGLAALLLPASCDQREVSAL
jgi:hypothetical protein